MASEPLNSRRTAWSSFATAMVLSFAGCGSSSPAKYDYDSGVGGPVTGLVDVHCAAVEPVLVDQATCKTRPDGGSVDTDAGTAADGGLVEELAPVLFNSEGDDDDCKYHVKFMMTAAKVDTNATLRVTVTHLSDGQPAPGAAVEIVGFLTDNDTHVLPNANTKSTETPAGAGIYVVTPVQFDASGRWTLLFHLYETCYDYSKSSPHGHVAFYVDVNP